MGLTAQQSHPAQAPCSQHRAHPHTHTTICTGAGLPGTHPQERRGVFQCVLQELQKGGEQDQKRQRIQTHPSPEVGGAVTLCSGTQARIRQAAVLMLDVFKKAAARHALKPAYDIDILLLCSYPYCRTYALMNSRRQCKARS